MKTGTTTLRNMKARKTGRVFTYEVYEASSGGLFVARMVKINGSQVGPGEWSGPSEDQDAAIKEAFHLFREKHNARIERDAEYYRSGGY